MGSHGARALTRATSTLDWRLLGRPVRVYPNAVLLGAQLLGIVVYPFAGGGLGRALFSLLQLCVLVVAVAAVRATPALTQVSWIIGVPAAVLTVWQAMQPDDRWVSLASNCTHAVFYAYLAYALLRYMFDDQQVSADEMFATASCFTVLAWAFAYLYGAVQDVWGPAQFASAHGGELNWMEMLFLSFTTMTGTGLSDISPVGPHARSIVMLEQFTGMFYIALVIARVLAMTRGKFQNVERDVTRDTPSDDDD